MYLYTKRGMYHKNHGEISGDIVRGVDDGHIAILALADGVSSCAYGAEGAKAVSSMAIEYVDKQYLRFGFIPREWAKIMLGTIQKRMQMIAEKEGNHYEEYSSTLMIAVIDRDKGTMNYCNVGDGLILSIGDKKCPVICMPQGGKDGCPVFTTEGVENAIETGIIRLSGIKHIFICSDGTWNIMYNQNIMKPDVKANLIKGNFDGFVEFVKTADSIDDCCFAIADVRRAA